jgi:hypothetical protein
VTKNLYVLLRHLLQTSAIWYLYGYHRSIIKLTRINTAPLLLIPHFTLNVSMTGTQEYELNLMFLLGEHLKNPNDTLCIEGFTGAIRSAISVIQYI